MRCVVLIDLFGGGDLNIRQYLRLSCSLLFFPSLANTTRVLVTHKLEVLNAVDQIIVLGADGAVLAQIEGGRPLQRKIASALDTFGIDSTCVVKTERHGRIEKTRFFLADGRLPRVPLHWSGADEVQRINPDYLSVVHTGAGFEVRRRGGETIARLQTRKAAHAYIAYLDRMGARKRVVFKNGLGETKFTVFAR